MTWSGLVVNTAQGIDIGQLIHPKKAKEVGLVHSEASA